MRVPRYNLEIGYNTIIFVILLTHGDDVKLDHLILFNSSKFIEFNI